VLPHVDFDLVAANPKAFMGFSDITHLHIAIRQETGLATFHGPGFGSMGIPERTDFSFESAVQAFKGHADGMVARDPDDPYVRAIAPGAVTAPLVGGNLYSLQHGFGTPWEVQLGGCILFFEDVNLPPYQLDDLLTHFRSAGKLEGVVGVVVGEMFQCDWRETRPEAPRTRSLEDVLERQLIPLGVPVIYKLPLGHGKHLATIPLGVPATLDADARSLTIDHPGAQPAS
jgi:muramoyltetrapeptide carboxypeptidase